MEALDTSDVESFTNGRLTAGASTERLLAAAFAAARRYCGWNVCPVIADDEIVVDGPGGRLLSLPTLNLLTVSAVTECGANLDVSTLDVSRLGTIEKYPTGVWTSRKSGIAVTMTHGFTAAEAADFLFGVLRLVDVMSAAAAGQRDTPDLLRKKIDDVEYQWTDRIVSDNEQLSAIFAPFRIVPAP